MPCLKRGELIFLIFSYCIQLSKKINKISIYMEEVEKLKGKDF